MHKKQNKKPVVKKQNKKPVVLIVECMSSSVNYLKDLEERGYKPVVLESAIGKNNAFYSYTMFGAKQPQVLEERKKYVDTLKEVKKINPILIVTGADHGLKLTLKLCRDLGIRNNDLKNFPKMRDKYISQQTLKKCGIRCIETIKYKNYRQALDFFHKHNNKIVVKPAKGAASIGVSVCSNEQELKHSIALCQNKNNHFLTNKKPILQEFIDGEEYIVNTISCNGVVKVSSVYHYHKKLIPGYAPVYSWTTSHSPSEKEIKPIVDYALKVVKAIGIKWGPVHGEYKVDKKGPVLIETNCRIPGGSMPNIFLDQIWGHHETNLVLDAYLNPKKFLAIKGSSIEPKSYGIIKHIILDKPIYVVRTTPHNAFRNLKSFLCFNMGVHETVKNCLLHKTIDYETSAGNVFLVNKNRKQLLSDFNKVVDFEHNHLNKLFIISKNKK